MIGPVLFPAFTSMLAKIFPLFVSTFPLTPFPDSCAKAEAVAVSDVEIPPFKLFTLDISPLFVPTSPFTPFPDLVEEALASL